MDFDSEWEIPWPNSYCSCRGDHSRGRFQQRKVQYYPPLVRSFSHDLALIPCPNLSFTRNFFSQIYLFRHGVKQPRNPWTDGPAYITQCPIQPGNRFSQKVIFSNEEGTLWWHAHSDWSRATVHGAIVVYPRPGALYPFTKPYGEVPIILGDQYRFIIHY